MTLEEAEQKLHQLAKELGVEVGGCGCCGSPWLMWSDENAKGVIDNVRIGLRPNEPDSDRRNT